MEQLTIVVDISDNLTLKRRSAVRGLIINLLGSLHPNQMFALVGFNEDLRGYKTGQFCQANESQLALEWFDSVTASSSADFYPLLRRLAFVRKPNRIVLLACGPVGLLSTLLELADSLPPQCSLWAFSVDYDGKRLQPLCRRLRGDVQVCSSPTYQRAWKSMCALWSIAYREPVSSPFEEPPRADRRASRRRAPYLDYPRGARQLLEQISRKMSPQAICSIVNDSTFDPVDTRGALHVGRAAEAWQLCRLDLVTEIVTVLTELRALPDRGLFFSLVNDLSAQPLRNAWPPDHPRRVAVIARVIASEGVDEMIRLGYLSESAHFHGGQLEGLWWGALLHDFGKLLIPPEILCEPNRIKGQDFEMVKEHPQMGYAGLASLMEEPWSEVLPVILHHHERWDGTGYPDGLTGHEIPWAAQIVGLANFCDALMTPRPYRSFSWSKVIDFATQEAGRSFNPVLVRALIGVSDIIPALCYAHGK